MPLTTEESVDPKTSCGRFSWSCGYAESLAASAGSGEGRPRDREATVRWRPVPRPEGRRSLPPVGWPPDGPRIDGRRGSEAGHSGYDAAVAQLPLPETVRRNVWRAFVREEPFRLLFPVGILFGVAGAGHWLLYGLGVTGHYSGVVHATLQIQGFMACFITGFLLTALPKFTVGPVVATLEGAAILAGLALVAGGLAAHAWAVMEAGTLVQLAGLGAFAARRWWGRATTQPPVLVWLAVGWLHAVAGAGLLLWVRLDGPPAVELLGRRLLWQGACLAVVLGMGGHLVPRVLGYPEGVVPKHPAPRGLAGVAALFRGEPLRWWLAGALLAAGFLVEHLGHERAGRLLRAAVVSGSLLSEVPVWRPPRVRAPFAWGVWGSVWLVAAGVWAAALAVRHHVAMLHLIFIGGFSLMVLTIGARVTLSHGGYMALEPRNRPIRWVVAGVLAALALRLAADYTPEHYFQVVAAAAASWLAACLLWLAYHLPKMVYRDFPVIRPTRPLRVAPPQG
ncbi:MAG: NnrS family protein [Nitrospirae bacterium]|nr:MAG: NnrS family protein [Nitrospirota bacterium]